MEILAVALVAAVALALQHIGCRRAQADIAALLARISTEPRIEIRPMTVEPKPDVHALKYISDEQYMDAAWNELRGETESESE